ncbi:Acyl transferase/acyl hydrolase/lysophospholipase,Ketoacyl-synthetase, C- [Cinara cedri]|uniref:Fatty acid synthase n=1 Tax=Cinara cedri TaxID=506608 RepID=A0A5E4NBK8_9HEMI|nr:Acyl transferase/acyl hydrolase/lysophospholipase,Ketoacyl-synthetase, C- [Cinara cedri]
MKISCDISQYGSGRISSQRQYTNYGRAESLTLTSNRPGRKPERKSPGCRKKIGDGRIPSCWQSRVNPEGRAGCGGSLLQWIQLMTVNFHLTPRLNVVAARDVKEISDHILETAEVLKGMPGSIEIVISGIAGRFPECDSTEEFKQKLYSNADLLTVDDRRWTPGIYGIPARTGKLKDISKFDAEFFGIHSKLANSMDVQLRILLEVVHEAIVDAGVNPQEICGTKTGVYVGMMTTDTSDYFERTPETLTGYETIGAIRSMLANRISFQFDLKGPSVTIDTACSSSLFCLHDAITAIKTGQCDAAIIAGSNLLLKPAISVIYHKFNMLSPTGTSRPFDIGANGYVRSEAIVAIYIRKSTDAKRVYATVVGTSTNTDGFKTEGATYPSQAVQSQLIRDTYARSNIKPIDVHYVEAHGTATGVGDKQELNAISDVFCIGRKSPLLVGSVKSNAGHTEPVSGLVSIIKVLYALETGIIPATINFERLNHNIPKLVTGELKVVDKQMPLPGDMVSVNSFGIGGTNVHVVLKANSKKVQTESLPKLNIPRLVFLSGRTRETLNEQFEIIESYADNYDFLTLIDDIYKSPISGHRYSGYSILRENPQTVEIAPGNVSGEKRPVYFIFPGMGSQSIDLVKDLMKFDVFRGVVDKAHTILIPLGFSVYDLFYKSNDNTFKNIVNVTITIIIVQIGLVDILHSFGITPDGIIGHSVGEIACAYADGCFNLEESLLTIFWRSKILTEIEVVVGAMVAVGLSWEETQKRLPEGVVAACHNSSDSVTISGPKEITLKFTETLKQEGVFTKPVDSLGYAFHSPYLQKLIPALKPYYAEIMKNPKPKSNRWKSTSLPEDQWNTPEGQYSSMDYHLNNISSPVYFHSALQFVPENAITIEIAPHCLLQAILKRSLPPTVTNVSLTKKVTTSHINYLLEAIGKLYIAGAEPQLKNIYGKVEYPVVKGTPMISPMLKWDHSNDYLVPNFSEQSYDSNGNTVEVNLKNDEDKFLIGHTIDGHILYPAAGYITLIWKAFAKLHGKWFEDVPVVFQNIRFLRPTLLNTENIVKFNINILKGSGEFELLVEESVTVSGIISLFTKNITEYQIEHPIIISEKMVLNSDDFYKELRLRGYQYKDAFLGFVESNIEGSKGKITWTGNWVSYIDTLLQFELISIKSRDLYLPTYIKEVIIDPIYHKKVTEGSLNSKGIKNNDIILYFTEANLFLKVEVNHYGHAKSTQSGGVVVSKLKVTPLPLRKTMQQPAILEYYSFIPYMYKTKELSTYDVLYTLVGLFMENIGVHNLKAAEFYKNNLQALDIVQIIETEAKFYVNYSVLSNKPVNVEKSKLSALDIKIINFDIKNAILTDKYHLLVAEDSQFDSTLLSTFSTALMPRGFLLLVENITVVPSSMLKSSNLQIVAIAENNNNKYFLLKKLSPKYEYITLKIEDGQFSWIEKLKKELANINTNPNKKVILYSDQNINGVLGLSKCLVEEFSGEENPVRCILVDSDKKYTFKDFESLLETDLLFNVERDGVWGSYRHLPINIKTCSNVLTAHAKVSVLAKGDLTTLQWIESPKYANSSDNLIKISYIGINGVDITAVSSMKTEFGVEFSGVKANGKKVMGLVKSGALSSTINHNNALLWNVPQSWTLKQAATFPYSFFMATYALMHNGKLPKAKNVLVCLSNNSINYAIISVALSLKCKVFVIAETEEQLKVVKTNHSEIIPFSTTMLDSKFINIVSKTTQTRGIDYIILSKNVPNRLPEIFANEAKVVVTENIDISILPNSLNRFEVISAKFEDIPILNSKFVNNIYSFVKSKVKCNLIKPLSYSVFPYTDVQSAFRAYVNNTAAHNKIIVEVNGEVSKLNLEAYKQVYFDQYKSYIFSGGLGGFGMELTNWAVERGAKNIVLCSRSGIQSGYQNYRLNIWKSQGVNVEISTYDLTTLAGANDTVKLASSLGPVGGIFNLAGILKDGLFKNQSISDFQNVYNSKVLTTKYLDEASRGLNNNLQYFVTFSSISCGRGNKGQTNYGYANSIMERITEQRQRQGLPAQSIQWGGIGDVGMAYKLIHGNNKKEINGTLPQNISSCLSVLDVLLTQSLAVVTSHVIPNKRNQTDNSKSQSLSKIIAGIMGIQDPSSVKPTSTLADLGIDSLMGVDIKQTIERGFGLSLNNTQIQQLKFSELDNINAQ